MDFQSLTNEHKKHSFDSFNGTELKLYLQVPTKIDAYERAERYDLIELGTASSVSGAKEYDVSIVEAIGFDVPIGVSIGDMLVSGRLSIEVLSDNFVSEVKKSLAKSDIKRIEVVSSDGSTTYSTKVSNINYFNEFPLLNLVIIGVKETDKSKKIQKTIEGIRFVKQNSGIGITQLGVNENYQFIAKDMTDFKPVEGVIEEDDGVDSSELDEGSLFS